MARLRLWGLSVLAIALAACGEDDATDTPSGASSTGPTGGDAGADAGCAADAISVQGACIVPGVPSDACGEGFVSDDAGGCVAVLPPDPCPNGQMAVPGETSCHEIAPCGDGKWGDIPVEANTVYVDGSYAGGGSDGSVDKPFTTISDGVEAAPSGGLVAVAEGDYAEVVTIEGKSVRLWGRCPALVSIHTAKPNVGAIDMREGADGSEIHRVALRGTTGGIAASGPSDVLVEEVWADGPRRGIDMEDTLGPTQFTIRRSLVEGAVETGILVLGADVTVEECVVRGTKPIGGLQSQGIGAEENIANKHPSKLHVRKSNIEQNVEYGIVLAGVDATIESTQVDGTQPNPGGLHGVGVVVQDGPVRLTTAALSQVVIKGNHHVGIYVAGATTTIDATVVRDTQSQVSDMKTGRGITVEAHPTTGARAKIDVKRTLIADNHEVGFGVAGGDASLEGVAIRGTMPRPLDERGGYGIEVGDPTGQATTVSIRSSMVSDSREAGLFVWNSVVTLEDSLITATSALPDGRYGDGILAAAASQITFTRSSIRQSARAGASNFSSTFDLGDSTFACNPIDLDAESLEQVDALFNDNGGNLCGCEQPGDCQIVSSMLDPPASL